MLRVIGRKLYAALGLFDDMKLVAFLQLEPGKNVLGQDEAKRIADLLDLDELTFSGLVRLLVHDIQLRYTYCITQVCALFNKCFTFNRARSRNARRAIPHASSCAAATRCETGCRHDSLARRGNRAGW